MPLQVRLEVGGEVHEVTLQRTPAGWDVEVDGTPLAVARQKNGAQGAFLCDGEVHHVQVRDWAHAAIDGEAAAFRVLSVSGGAAAAGPGAARGTVKVRPPMIGRLESVRVRPGDRVEPGQVLFVLEAMKMHNEVRSPCAGTVRTVSAQPGAAVEPGQTVLEIER